MNRARTGMVAVVVAAGGWVSLLASCEDESLTRAGSDPAVDAAVPDGEVPEGGPDADAAAAPRAVHDYDGDGTSDLALWERATGEWQIRTVSGAALADGTNWGFYDLRVTAGDYDGDGRWELGGWDSARANWWIATMDGQVLAGPIQYGWDQAVPVPEDYDGDGAADLAVYYPAESRWYARTLSGTVLAEGLQYGPAEALPVPADYDGDGRADLGVYDPTTGRWDVASLDGIEIVGGEIFGYPVVVPVPADYDGDGRADLAIYDRWEHKWSIRRTDGDVILQDEPFGADDQVPVPGDYDGDGITDLALYDRVTHDWHIRTVDGATIETGSLGARSEVAAGGRPSRGGCRVAAVGPEEVMGTFTHRSSIAVDGKDQPHIAQDQYGTPLVAFYDKVNRSWQTLELNIQDYSAYNQYYNPHLEIDRFDRGWTSGILVGGLGFFVRTDVASAPSAPTFSEQHINPQSWDTGLLAIDQRADQVMGFSSAGYWRLFAFDDAAVGKMTEVAAGQMYAGSGGEKNAIAISGATPVDHPGVGPVAVRHAATGGSTGTVTHDAFYQNSLRQAAGQEPVAWASSPPYDFDGDHRYVWVVADRLNPLVAYVFEDTMNAGTVINVYSGDHFLFAPGELPSVAGVEIVMRVAPQATACATGGAMLAWSDGAIVRLRSISPLGVMGEDVEVGPGRLPSITTDSQGDLHLAYVNGGTRYRRILTY